MFNLSALPFPIDSLEPHMSGTTLEIHHGKHHQSYVNNLNDMVKDTPLATLTVEEIIHATKHDTSKVGIFNNAAQVWNHTFFWNSLKPNGGGQPTGDVATYIKRDFGNFEAFKDQFIQSGVTQFGSGWVWLVSDKGTLKVTKTSNANTPFTNGQRPLLTCDVWEHAYYLDYQNRRQDYLKIFLEYLVNWDFASANINNQN